MIDPRDLVPVEAGDAGAVKDFLKKNGVSLTADEYARVVSLLGRRPSLVELHIFNVMWSEHCSYKSSRWALKEYLPTNAPHVVLGPGEDAGIIRFAEINGRSWCLVMAHESHNHPSQVLPVEGAATGIGGIVRDVYCMGADVVGVMDPLRFGDPDGPNAARVRDIAFGVVDGIAQYGNALGVPTYGGETFFDASFDDNCLVNVVAFGIVEERGIIRSRVPEEARHVPYDLILVGKPTDASGFGGAAFASERLESNASTARQGAVQVPDPFVKRVLAEAIKEMLKFAREQKIPIGFKDLGAGGISCAFSEMPQASGFGAHVDLDKVNCAFGDLLPEVIACSETQERFAIAVPTRVSRDILAIYNRKFEMPRLYAGAGAVVIGRVTTDDRFRLTHGRRVVCDAEMDAITSGISYRREQKERPRRLRVGGGAHAGANGIREAVTTLLGSINVCDKSAIFQHYDSEVQGRAVLRPGEADAAVEIFVPGANVALAAAIGSHSRIGMIDPYAGGAWSVFEATRNLACVGALPLAVTDCLNFGDPEDPGVFHEFVESVKGIGDACRAMKLFGGDHPLPVISGNVSLYNQSEKGEAIAPTPIVACAGRIDDASRARGFALKQVGSRLVLLGKLHDDMGGSEYERLFGSAGHPKAPHPDFAFECALVKVLVEGFAKRLVLAAHDVALGGLLVTVSEMAIASAPFDVGASVVLDAGVTRPMCFSEMGGVVVEVSDDTWGEFEKVIERHALPFAEVGRTKADVGLEATLAGDTIRIGMAELRAAHRGKLAEVLYS